MNLMILSVLALVGCDGFNPFTMGYRAKRSEVTRNLEGIHQAEVAYYDAFDTFVEVPDPVPRAIGELTKGQVSWNNHSNFDTLGWAPSGKVRGTYWVELLDDGMDFRAHGVIDIDGDGEASHAAVDRDGSIRWLVEDEW